MTRANPIRMISNTRNFRIFLFFSPCVVCVLFWKQVGVHLLLGSIVSSSLVSCLSSVGNRKNERETRSFRRFSLALLSRSLIFFLSLAPPFGKKECKRHWQNGSAVATVPRWPRFMHFSTLFLSPTPFLREYCRTKNPVFFDSKNNIPAFRFAKSRTRIPSISGHFLPFCHGGCTGWSV